MGRIKEWWKGDNDVVIDLLETSLSVKENEMLEIVDDFEKKLNIYEQINNSSMTTFQTQNLWSLVFKRAASKKSELVAAVDKIQSSFIHIGIVELLMGDAFAPSPTTNNVLDLTSKNEKINTGLKDFQEKHDIDSLVVDIGDSAITYGEYYLGVEGKKDVGITKISDNIDQGSVVSIYDGPQPSKFLRMKKGSTKEEIEIIKPENMVHFCMGSRKLRIKIDGVDGMNKISEYVRVGRPLFYGTFDLVNALLLMTALVPASYLQKINGTSIISVQVPEGMDPQKAFKITRRYENLLNKISSYDPTKGDITVNDLIAQAGKFKCIPAYGDKGRLEKIDPRREDLPDIGIFQELKKDIFGTVGVPYNFFYGGEVSKGDSLKQFARYVRSLSLIQVMITKGIKQLARIHLNHLDLKAAPSHIEVKFANSLISVEELDKIEFSNSMVSVLGEVVTILSDIAKGSSGTLDGKKLEDFLNKHLKLLGLDGLIKIPKGDIDFNTEEV